MRSYEVRGRTGRAVRRKKSKRREEDEEERGSWAADMTCYRFREKKRQSRTGSRGKDKISRLQEDIVAGDQCLLSIKHNVTGEILSCSQTEERERKRQGQKQGMEAQSTLSSVHQRHF